MDINLELGRTVITPGALTELDQAEIPRSLGRHIRGDWGNVCPEDWKENDLSVEHGFRVLSEYTDKNGKRFWIITEADRSATTILLPEEY